jgi:hypothetical protein
MSLRQYLENPPREEPNHKLPISPAIIKVRDDEGNEYFEKNKSAAAPERKYSTQLYEKYRTEILKKAKEKYDKEKLGMTNELMEKVEDLGPKELHDFLRVIIYKHPLYATKVFSDMFEEEDEDCDLRQQLDGEIPGDDQGES